jgi:hypothetical protein
MFTGGTNGTAGAAEDGGCGEQVYKGEQVPLDIYIMFDQSASMSCSAGATNRWDAVKGALSGFVQSPGAATLNVGLGYFGTAASPPGSSCLPSDYKVDVPIGPLSTTAPAIVNSLNAHGPLTDTPTYPALQAAVSHAISWKAQHPGHTVVVVLVTDGQPNACGANNVSQIVATAQRGFDDGGIPTYVIGIIGPVDAQGVSTCNLDPNAPTVADLDSVAAAGGTTKALVVDTANTAQDPAAQFLATMNQVRQTAQIPCEYAIPTPTNGEPQDFTRVNLDYTDPNGGKGELLPAAVAPNKVGWTDSKYCDQGGWYYDKEPVQGSDPTKVILCPSTCTQLTMTFGFEVKVLLGCPTRPPPH